MYLFKIAYRNIYRNMRRSILCFVSIGLAVFIIIAMMSFMEGMIDSMKKVIQIFEVGHIQIYTKEFENKKDFLPIQYPITPEEGNLSDLIKSLKKIDNIKAVFTRIVTPATLTNSIIKHAILWGININEELKYNNFNIKDRSSGLLIGRYPEENKNECAIGLRMSRKMELIPKQIGTYEYKWILDSLTDDNDKLLLKSLYTEDINKESYTLNNALNKENELKLLYLFINAKKESLPEKIGANSAVIYNIFDNEIYKDFILESYNYDKKNDLYILKKDIQAETKDFLLSIFQSALEIKIPLKVMSSKYSDKFYQPKVVGIFDFDYAPIDEGYILVHFKRLQKLVNLNNQTQTINILVNNLKEVKITKDLVLKKINNDNIVVKSWEEFPIFALMNQFDFMYIIIYMIFVIMASFVIINTIIMIIHERIKEIGMMGALGLSRFEIVMVFFLEAIILSFIGSLFGTIVGGIGSYIGSLFPISFEAITGGVDFQVGNTIFITFSAKILFSGFTFGLLLSSACTIFPSLKSAFIEPVEALRR